ncbi:hypothetical protein SLUN_13010 [Streptomyces lunaelactis]|uniref:Uncharacterized protein n=1 Tax=Streptomyces lunaelactis TaxID=1535768 RepID=A0A2R4T1G2_9ACTN|nr:hypothetical protein [Streptomyces lunaelactis]AVZ72975.1 hypothetical protein SLUN_13010 [Streptomyces lunaelactis]NUK87123.1 hypothetical protein [Streptomyces lunaelactis]
MATDLKAWGRLVLDAESRGMSTNQACKWATETLTPVRRTKADPAVQRARTAVQPSKQMQPGRGETVTYSMNPVRGLPSIVTRTKADPAAFAARAAAVKQARERWRDAEKSFARLDTRIEQLREWEAGWRSALAAGYLF